MNAVPNNPDQSFDRRLTILETRFDTILPMLATKADIEALRVEFHAGLEKVRGEMKDLRAELFKAIHDATKWTIGNMVAVLLGANFAMFNAMKALIESSRSSPAIERGVPPESVPARPPAPMQSR